MPPPQKVIYQTGVDILGFPIYQEHDLFYVKGFNNKPQVAAKEVKQH